jgi:hypothetical protein
MVHRPGGETRGQMPPLFGKVDDEGDVQPGIVQRSFASRQAHAVIGEEKDDGIVCEAVLPEPAQDLADLTIHQGDAVEIASPGTSAAGGIRIKGRNGQLRRISAFLGPELRTDLPFKLFLRPKARAGLVSRHQVDDGEERLPGFASAPVCGVGALIPRSLNEGAFVVQVIVGLDVVGAVVAELAERDGERSDLGWHWELRA